MDAAVALPLAVTVLCHLLRQWDQLDPGLPVVLGWLLEDSPDTSHPPEGTQEEGDGLFDKDAVSLWAEPLRFVQHLCEPLSQLLAQPSIPRDTAQLSHLHRMATEQLTRVSQQLRALPTAAAFLHTAQWTQLRVQEESALACLRLLGPRQGKAPRTPWALGPSFEAEAEAC